MCPFMQFIEGGRRFQCCFCSCVTEGKASSENHPTGTAVVIFKKRCEEMNLNHVTVISNVCYAVMCLLLGKKNE